MEICSVRNVSCITTKPNANSIKNERGQSEVKGIAYLFDGKIRHSKPTRIKTLDEITWPDWNVIPVEKYLRSHCGVDTVDKRTMPIIASRGCPYTCSFCSSPQMWTTLWNSRSPRDVVNEILYYEDKYRVEHIEFYDLTLIINRKWILEFCEVLIQSGSKISFSLPAGTRVEAVNMEVLQALYSSGCTKLSLSTIISSYSS